MSRALFALFVWAGTVSAATLVSGSASIYAQGDSGTVVVGLSGPGVSVSVLSGNRFTATTLLQNCTATGTFTAGLISDGADPMDAANINGMFSRYFTLDLSGAEGDVTGKLKLYAGNPFTLPPVIASVDIETFIGSSVPVGGNMRNVTFAVPAPAPAILVENPEPGTWVLLLGALGLLLLNDPPTFAAFENSRKDRNDGC